MSNFQNRGSDFQIVQYTQMHFNIFSVQYTGRSFQYQTWKGPSDVICLLVVNTAEVCIKKDSSIP